MSFLSKLLSFASRLINKRRTLKEESFCVDTVLTVHFSGFPSCAVGLPRDCHVFAADAGRDSRYSILTKPYTLRA